MNNKEHTLWTEKYRPSSLEGYIGNEHILSKVRVYIESGDVPHLLLHGKAGTGKTTLAKIIAKNTDCDLLYVNASDENSVDTVRDKIKGFASTVGFRSYKLVILDEADFLTVNGQSVLRNLMETFSKHTRFILTCNYVEKILDPIQSRCQTFEVIPPSKKEVAGRMVDILNKEGISYDIKDVVVLVNSGYPDIRRVINSLSKQVVNNNLIIDKQSVIQSNYVTKVEEILKTESNVKTCFTKIRQLIADSKVRDFTELYKHLYDTVDDWGEGHVAPCILVIAEHQSLDINLPDKEINVMACMIKLIQEIK